MRQLMRMQKMSIGLKWVLVVAVIPLCLACDNSAKKMKLPSLEGAPEQLGGN